jgi:TPR repeat protein
MTRKRRMTVDSALLALEAGKATVAFRALKRLAESGDAGAYHMLGYLYDVGEGTRRNSQNAMRWYVRGYREGQSTCAINIATMYRDAGDTRKEFEWYQRAAALKDGDAKLEVAIRYLAGKGVRRSVKLAIQQLESVLRTKHTSEAGRDTARQLLRGCKVGRRAA